MKNAPETERFLEGAALMMSQKSQLPFMLED